jgi:hypothetical protein
MAGNPYWAYFLDYAPFCAVFWVYPRIGRGAALITAFLAFMLLMIKGLCGYEYLSCAAMSALVPVVYFETKRTLSHHKWCDWLGLGRMTLIGSAAVLGGIAAMAMHVAKAAAYFGTWRQGFDALVIPMVYSTSGDKEISVTHVVRPGTIYSAIMEQIAYPTICGLPFGGVLCIALCVVLMIATSRRFRGVRPVQLHLSPSDFALLTATSVAGLSSISWWLAISHVVRHAYVDWVMYYIPFLPMLSIAVVIFTTRELNAIRDIAARADITAIMGRDKQSRLRPFGETKHLAKPPAA